MSSQIKKPNTNLQRLAHISLLIYPIVAHAGILMEHAVFPVVYLLAAIYINSLKLISQHLVAGITFTVLSCIVIYAVVSADLHTLIIYLPPVLIPCWLAYIFLGSLRTERALISRMAEKMEGQLLDQQHLRYTRRLTIVWGAVFILMICEAVILAIWAPFEIWSWWVHVGNYFIIAALFLIEMSVRHLFIGKRAQFFQMFKTMLQRNWHD